MVTSIVILTYNQLEYSKQCIDSIRKYTNKDEYEIIVVDNGSKDETVSWLEAQDDIRIIKNEVNLGFPKGCNQGIRIANGDNILLLNNDVVVTKNWLSNLINCLYKEENIGAVGPTTNYCSYYTSIPAYYKSLDEMQNFAESFNKLDETKWIQRIKLVGFCMLIKKKVLDEVGLLDERFTPGNYEDDDLSLRIIEKGYKLYLCKDTFVHHHGHKSWKQNNIDLYKILDQNHAKFIDKWGFPQSDLYIYFNLFILIDKLIKDGLNILQIGAGCGATLLEMKRCYKQCNIYGVESNEKSAIFSNIFAQTKCIEYDKVHESFDIKFDIIILSSPVLKEDMVKVVESILKTLSPTGKIIMTKDNLCNYLELENLYKLKHIDIKQFILLENLGIG